MAKPLTKKQVAKKQVAKKLNRLLWDYVEFSTHRFVWEAFYPGARFPNRDTSERCSLIILASMEIT